MSIDPPLFTYNEPTLFALIEKRAVGGLFFWTNSC